MTNLKIILQKLSFEKPTTTNAKGEVITYYYIWNECFNRNRCF